MNVFRDINNNPKKDYAMAKALCIILQGHNYQAVFAGGVVRDMIKQVPYNDIDIATNCLPEKVIEILKPVFDKVKFVGNSFGVVIVSIDDIDIEIATFRADQNCDGRHPEKVEFCSLEQDAMRRDFTINAVYFDPYSEEIIDLVNGVSDIENNKLRFVGMAEQRIKEDYLRILRYIRFIIKGYHTDVTTDAIVNTMSLDFNTYVAKDRISKELIEKLLVKDVYKFIDTLKNFPNLFKAIFPTIYEHEVTDIFRISILIQRLHYVDSMNVDYRVYLALLYISIDVSVTTKELTEMRFSNSDIKYITDIISNYKKMYFDIPLHELRKLKACQYYNDMIIVADVMISDCNNFIEILDTYNYNKAKASNYDTLPEPLFTGTDLMNAFNIKPSPIFSTILDTTYYLQLDEIITTKDECIVYVKTNLL